MRVGVAFAEDVLQQLRMEVARIAALKKVKEDLPAVDIGEQRLQRLEQLLKGQRLKI